MDELVKAVAEQTGLSEAQARQAADVVIKFVKDKLPAPLASQVDTFLEKGDLASGAEDLLNMGKSLFGGK